MAPALFSRRMDAALSLAARAHQGQTRKGSSTPYIAHPFHVALILERVGAPPDVVVAGVLHDLLEDTAVTPDQLRDAMGPEVARLVEAVTQPSVEGMDPAGWAEVRAMAITKLERASVEVALLKGADTLHNLSSLLLDLEDRGVTALERFRRPVELQLWYYGEVVRVVGERLGAQHPLALELTHTLHAVRAAAWAVGDPTA